MRVFALGYAVYKYGELLTFVYRYCVKKRKM